MELRVCAHLSAPTEGWVDKHKFLYLTFKALHILAHSNLSYLVSYSFQTQTLYPTVWVPSCPLKTPHIPDSWPSLRNFLLIEWSIVILFPQPVLSCPSRPRPVKFIHEPFLILKPAPLRFSIALRHILQSELYLVFNYLLFFKKRRLTLLFLINTECLEGRSVFSSWCACFSAGSPSAKLSILQALSNCRWFRLLLLAPVFLL